MDVLCNTCRWPMPAGAPVADSEDAGAGDWHALARAPDGTVIAAACPECIRRFEESGAVSDANDPPEPADSLTYEAVVGILRSWIGRNVSLVPSTDDPDDRLGRPRLSPRVYHGVLAAADLGPQTDDIASFSLPTQPPEPGRVNEGGVGFAVMRETFDGAAWAAGCAGTVLRVWNGPRETEFILRV